MGTITANDMQQGIELGSKFFGPLGDSYTASVVQLSNYIFLFRFVLFVIVELILSVHHILGGNFLPKQEAPVLTFGLRRKVGHLLEEFLLLLLLLLRLLMVLFLLLLLWLLKPLLLLLLLLLIPLRLLPYNLFRFGFLRAKNAGIVGLEVFVCANALLPEGLPIFKAGIAVLADDDRRTWEVFDLY